MIYFFVMINIAACTVFGIDKWKAVHKKWRISEAALMGLACIGGSAGSLIGMYVFRHKTRKPMFRYGIPIILVLQIMVIVYLKRRGFLIFP